MMQVRISNTLSDKVVIKNEIPRGQYHMLLLLAINDIAQKISQPVQRRLFADDVNVLIPTADFHLLSHLEC